MSEDGPPTRPYAPAPPELPTAPGMPESEEQPVPPTIAATEVTVTPGGTVELALPAPGYKLGRMIGRGGMGEVIAAHDGRIGRGVAVKRMRNPKPTREALARFLREARIQARLDHPSIVPVHEIGVDDQGRLFFTMKRCTGTTLSRLIADGGSFHQMLRAFVDVCLAIDFAHSRGVVHRDLKPANIMLGDYGEVYVLDWGVARVLADPPDPTEAPMLQPEETPDPEDSTKSGALLGTPGYIAPEQIMGQPAAAPADVYALGSMLFEILACEPLHPRGQNAIGRTLSSPQESPAKRRPDRGIPPELDAACFAALADDPAMRPTARALADRVQAYLDGDRDTERRRTLAAQQVAAATDGLATGDSEARIAALRKLGRAIALDPESVAAATMLSSLLLEPPKQMPEELAHALEEHELRMGKDRSRKTIYAYLAVVALLPIALVLDIKNWAMLLAFYGCVAIGMLSAWLNSKSGKASMPVVLTVTLLGIVLFSRVASPFVLTPLIICGVLAGITPIPWLVERRWAVLAWAVLASLAPVALEWLHVLPGTWSIHDGSMMIQSDIFQTVGLREEILLAFVNTVLIGIVAMLAVSLNHRRRESQTQLFVHAWHLRQLIPQARPWETRRK